MITNIQILRAFAAINVCIYHIISAAKAYSQSTTVLTLFDGWGANGVDIFFVISGFVMLHTQLSRRKSPLEFFKSRVIRIVPVYWLLTFFVIFLFLLFPTLFREILITPFWAFSSLFFFSFIGTSKFPVLYTGWTLEWEMIFYLVFSFALFFKSWRLLAVFVVIAITLVAWVTKSWIILEFLFGMFVAYLYHYKHLSKEFGHAVMLLGIIFLMLSLTKIVKDYEIPRIFIWGIPSFLIVLGSVIASQYQSLFLTYLGNASYSIYLVQILTVPAFYKLSNKLLSGWNTDLLALLCLMFSVFIGCIFYSFAEKRITEYLKNLSGI